jgi:hypothetical protein
MWIIKDLGTENFLRNWYLESHYILAVTLLTKLKFQQRQNQRSTLDPILSQFHYEDGCLPGCCAVMSTHRHDEGGSKYLWNVGELLPDYTAQQPRRQPSSYSPPWELQISLSFIMFTTRQTVFLNSIVILPSHLFGFSHPYKTTCKII